MKVAKVHGITAEDLEKFISESKKKLLEKEEELWIPNHEPDAVPVRIQEVEPDEIVTPDLSGQKIELYTARGEKPSSEVGRSEEISISKTLLVNRKRVTRWGEEYVYNSLMRKYQGEGNIIETN